MVGQLAAFGKDRSVSGFNIFEASKKNCWGPDRGGVSLNTLRKQARAFWVKKIQISSVKTTMAHRCLWFLMFFLHGAWKKHFKAPVQGWTVDLAADMNTHNRERNAGSWCWDPISVVDAHVWPISKRSHEKAPARVTTQTVQGLRKQFGLQTTSSNWGIPSQNQPTPHKSTFHFHFQ